MLSLSFCPCLVFTNVWLFVIFSINAIIYSIIQYKLCIVYNVSTCYYTLHYKESKTSVLKLFKNKIKFVEM